MKKVHILIPSLTTICLLPFASTISCNKEKAYDGIPINIPQEVTVDFGFSTVNIQVLSSEPIDIKSGHTYTFNVKMSDWPPEFDPFDLTWSIICAKDNEYVPFPIDSLKLDTNNSLWMNGKKQQRHEVISADEGQDGYIFEDVLFLGTLNDFMGATPFQNPIQTTDTNFNLHLTKILIMYQFVLQIIRTCNQRYLNHFKIHSLCKYITSYFYII